MRLLEAIDTVELQQTQKVVSEVTCLKMCTVFCRLVVFILPEETRSGSLHGRKTLEIKRCMGERQTETDRETKNDISLFPEDT